RHALAVPDATRAGGIVERHATAMLTRGEVRTLRDWVESLPEEEVRARPQLGLRHAWALTHANALEAVEPRLRGVEEWLVAHPGTPIAEVTTPEGEIASIRSRVAAVGGDEPRASSLGRRQPPAKARDDYG